eukprot:3005075-Pyramimonas_sp.AAC.1
MAKSKAMVFAWQTCYGVEARIDAHCKSRRLQVRSSYSAETLAAACTLDDCFPTIVTLHELHAGP